MSGLTDAEFLQILKTRCIGLTGGIATGKSTVATILGSHGYHVYDADKFAKKIVEPGSSCLAKIAEIFGSDILRADGSLDRQILRQRSMQDSAKRKRLESITHPAIQNAFKSEVEKHELSQHQIFFYEAALLFETGRDQLFKEVWATFCPENMQIQRTMARSQWSSEDIKQVLGQQMPARQKADLATQTIDTDCSLEDLTRKTLDLVRSRA